MFVFISSAFERTLIYCIVSYDYLQRRHERLCQM